MEFEVIACTGQATPYSLTNGCLDTSQFDSSPMHICPPFMDSTSMLPEPDDPSIFAREPLVAHVNDWDEVFGTIDPVEATSLAGMSTAPVVCDRNTKRDGPVSKGGTGDTVHLPAKRGRKKTIRSEKEEQQRVKQLRERNSIAARTFRARRKSEVAELRDQASELGKENSKLQGTVDKLRGKMLKLKEETLQHRSCGNGEIDTYLLGLYETLMDSDSSPIYTTGPSDACTSHGPERRPSSRGGTEDIDHAFSCSSALTPPEIEQSFKLTTCLDDQFETLVSP